MDIRGRTVVVAGGAGSLGSVIATSLLERGARIAILDTRLDAESTPGPDVLALQVDVANEDAVLAALETIVGTFGKISALVNCAGLIHSEPLINITERSQRTHRVSTWDAIIRSNLTSAFVLGARVAEHMASNRVKGVLINFSSISSGGNPGQTAYSAAKAGIEAMTKVWSRELGPLGIRALSIAPGFVATPSTSTAMSEAALSELARRTPLLRLAKPSEIASAVAFAIENDFITGTTIAIDGGLVL